MSSKKLQVRFHCPDEVYEIDLKIIASLIANKEFEGKIEGNLDAYMDRIEELQNDEFGIFEYAWDIPWNVLKEYAVRIGKNNIEDEWKNGRATISVVEFV